MGHVTFRKYSEDDCEFVYEVKKTAYQKYVEAYWGAWVENVQRSYFDAFICQAKENSYIIQYDGGRIGFYSGKMLKNGNYEIENICIIPAYQGRGIGTRILKGILDSYCDTDVELQYFKQNPVGGLYDRLGFQRCGETGTHYRMIKLRKGL